MSSTSSTSSRDPKEVVTASFDIDGRGTFSVVRRGTGTITLYECEAHPHIVATGLCFECEKLMCSSCCWRRGRPTCEACYNERAGRPWTARLKTLVNKVLAIREQPSLGKIKPAS